MKITRLFFFWISYRSISISNRINKLQNKNLYLVGGIGENENWKLVIKFYGSLVSTSDEDDEDDADVWDKYWDFSS